MSEHTDGICEDRSRQQQDDKLLDAIYGNEPAPISDQVNDYLDEANMHDIMSNVIDYAVDDELAATLKAMLTAYQFSYYGNSKADREQYAADFVVFAKSFANVCIGALEKSLEDK